MPLVKLYLAFCQRRPNNDPLHWIILAVPEGSSTCTYYHVVGGPTQGITNYEMLIQANKRADSYGIASTEYVGTIDAKDIGKLKASAQAATPQHCQRRVVEVLTDLESKNLIHSGTADKFAARVESLKTSSGSSSESTDSSSTSTNTLPTSSRSSADRNTVPISTSNSQWVYDDKYKKHRYWNGTTWVWQT